MNFEKHRSKIVASSLALFLCSCLARGSEASDLTTQRPILSTDTATAAEGKLELEVGGSRSSAGSFAASSGLNWGLAESTELFLALPSFRDEIENERRTNGFEDLEFGLRHRFLEEARAMPSAALQGVVRFPTGDRNDRFSSGTIDFFASGVATKTIGSTTNSLFVQLGLLGDRGDHVDLEHTIAALSALPLGRGWGAYAELAMVTVPERDLNAALTTIGASFALSTRFVLDVGASFGITDDAPDSTLHFGLTTLPVPQRPRGSDQGPYRMPRRARRR